MWTVPHDPRLSQHNTCIEPAGLDDDEIRSDNYIAEDDRNSDSLTQLPTASQQDDRPDEVYVIETILKKKTKDQWTYPVK